MTTYTRKNRLYKRDAYLLQKYGANTQAILDELKTHSVIQPRVVKDFTLPELSEGFSRIVKLLEALKDKTHWEKRGYLPDLSGELVGIRFAPEGKLEVTLRKAKPVPFPRPTGYVTQWDYRSVVLPEYLFLGDEGKILSYLRNFSKSVFQREQRLREEQELAARRKLEADYERVKKQIAEAERKLVTWRKTEETLSARL